MKKIDYSLYLVTDRTCIKNQLSLKDAVEQAIKGGVSIVQLREKNISTLEFYNLSKEVQVITKKYNIPLIINDRLDIALAINADGLHIGQDDMPCNIARKILGKNKIIGVSASNYNEAINGEKDGADYLGVGSIYSTETKTNAILIDKNELKKIQENINIPFVLIGGMNKNTIPNFLNLKPAGYSIISAIMGANNIFEATKELKEIIKL